MLNGTRPRRRGRGVRSPGPGGGDGVPEATGPRPVYDPSADMGHFAGSAVHMPPVGHLQAL
jgi:hypothetical protein